MTIDFTKRFMGVQNITPMMKEQPIFGGIRRLGLFPSSFHAFQKSSLYKLWIMKPMRERKGDDGAQMAKILSDEWKMAQMFHRWKTGSRASDSGNIVLTGEQEREYDPRDWVDALEVPATES